MLTLTNIEGHKCLLKEGKAATSTDNLQGINDRIDTLENISSAQDCAEACTKHESCDTFEQDDYNHKCLLLNGTQPDEKHQDYKTFGWCPKGKNTQKLQR